eukprot:m.17077 g.17077  ORF g.17077 m.17077 type:complete len:61 (-) comp4722_c1_seq2:159-341(-)
MFSSIVRLPDFLIQFKFPPAQKNFPVDLTNTPLTSGMDSNSFKTSTYLAITYKTHLMLSG